MQPQRRPPRMHRRRHPVRNRREGGASGSPRVGAQRRRRIRLERDGDGTAIRHQLPIVVVVSNNGGFTSRKTGGSVGRDLGFQRYDKMVEALGGCGEFVEQPSAIRPAIERAIKSGKTALLNVCTDPDAQATTDMGFAGYYPSSRRREV
jgi:Thiamine pyrophosphate enzyme, C-terminal TPP binding domain